MPFRPIPPNFHTMGAFPFHCGLFVSTRSVPKPKRLHCPDLAALSVLRLCRLGAAFETNSQNRAPYTGDAAAADSALGGRFSPYLHLLSLVLYFAYIRPSLHCLSFVSRYCSLHTGICVIIQLHNRIHYLFRSVSGNLAIIAFSRVGVCVSGGDNGWRYPSCGHQKE